MATWYVSKNGNNADGTSWATAWNEFNQVVWASVNPGDTVEIDGGILSMTYTTAMSVTASGTAGSRITVKLSTTSGKDGQVICRSRSVLLPEAGSGSTPIANVGTGFAISGNYVTVDGGKSRGIDVHGWGNPGVNPSGHHNVLRYMDIYDNGFFPEGTPGVSFISDGAGLRPGGYNNTFERCAIHDNGQDQILNGNAVNPVNYLFSECWIYNTRAHSGGAWAPFNYHPTNAPPYNGSNYRQHSDGWQIWQRTYITQYATFDRCVIGPGLMQGFLNEYVASDGSYTRIDDLTFTDCLFIWQESQSILNKQNTNSNRFTFDQCTFAAIGYDWDGNSGQAGSLNIGSGLDHVVTNNIFYKGFHSFYGGATYTSSGNIKYGTSGSSINGTVVDPAFTTDISGWSKNVALATQQAADFTPNAVQAIGKGAAVTSVAYLVNVVWAPVLAQTATAVRAVLVC